MLETLLPRGKINIQNNEIVFSKFDKTIFRLVVVVWCSNENLKFHQVKTEIYNYLKQTVDIFNWKAIGHEGKRTANSPALIADYAISEKDYETLRKNAVNGCVRVRVDHRTSISVMFAEDRYPNVKITERFCTKFAIDLGVNYAPEVDGALISNEVRMNAPHYNHNPRNPRQGSGDAGPSHRG